MTEADSGDLPFPLVLPFDALSQALARARGRPRGRTVDDQCDTAYALIDMREGGWEVRRGAFGESRDDCARILALVLAQGSGKPVAPKDAVLAEAAVDALRLFEFDMVRLATFAKSQT